jgi:hypothetical protein
MLVTRLLMSCGWLLQGMRSDTKLYLLMKRIFIRLGLALANVERH